MTLANPLNARSWWTNAPELEFVLACGRAPYDAAAAQRAAGLLRSPLDWDEVLRLSRYHGLIPNLNRALQALSVSEVPRDVRATLEAEARASAARGRFLTGELFRVLDALRESNIPALPLKGPVLAELLYGDPGARELADLDILVPRADALRAVEVAVSLGYTPKWHASPQFFERTLRHACDYELVNSRTGHLLEIHWATQPSSGIEPIEIDRAFDATIQVSICGRSVPFFNPETLCLFLSGHGAKHLWLPLKNLVDFARLLDVYPNLDWDDVFRRAEHTRSRRMVLFALSTLQSLLQVELLPSLRERVAHGPALSRMLGLSRKLLREERAATVWEHLTARFHLGERLRDRVDLGLKMLFVVTPGDWESLPGRPRPAWVYWLWRPLRLVAKYSPSRLTPHPMNFLRLVWLVGLAAVIVGSLAPAQSPVIGLIDRVHVNDKVEHLTAYAVLAALPALRQFRCRRLAPTLVFLCILGGVLELGQLFSPGRSCDWHDLLANVCGILAGAALVCILQRFASPAPA